MKMKTMLLATLISCAFGVGVHASEPQGPNLLPNADFSNAMGDWMAEDYEDETLTTFIGPGERFRVGEEDGVPHIVLESAGDFAALSGYPSVFVEEGEEYVLHYEVKAAEDGSRFNADLCLADDNRAYLRNATPGLLYQTLDAGDWEQQEVSVLALPGDAYVFPRFVVRSDSSVLVRNIHLEKLP